MRIGIRALRAVMQWLVWVGRHELGVLIAAAAVAAGVWAFTELADEVLEGETRGVDERLLLALRTPGDLADPVGPDWVEEMARDLTALGGVAVLVVLTVAVGGFLVLDGKLRMAGFVVLAVAGGVVASSLLKGAFDRPRPQLVPHGSYVYTASFPSGHSMMAAVTYLTLGALLARSQKRRRVRAYLLLSGILLTVGVGVSRVYLGVHWPTDVLAGWTAGAAWALLCWTVAKWLQGRREIEREGETHADVARAE